jgi:hypothetical protein
LGERGVVGDGVVGDGDGVEVERLEKFPFFFGRHERVGHELVEGFEALHVDLHGDLVALLGPVK